MDDLTEPRCALCGAAFVGTYRRSSTGTMTCQRHPWCEVCGAAHLRVPCHEHRARVLTAAHAAPRIISALRDMKALDVVLPRVPITLVSDLPGVAVGICNKRTRTAGSHVERTASIQLLRGQGPTRFGHTVVHEHVHALIHLYSRCGVDAQLEEGVCEMASMIWLNHRMTSREYMKSLWMNDDPIYGEQMRRAVAAAKATSAMTVLRSILYTGELPSPQRSARFA